MVLSERSSPDLRLQAVLALAEFTPIDGVPAALGSMALDPGETIDVRYSAAFAPTIVELMTPAGVVAQTAAPCSITGGMGENDAVCLDTVLPADGRALIRVSLDPDLACEGACDFTHYTISAAATAP